MKHLIDEKDRKILEILKENSSLSSHKISKKILIPVTTVNNRIKKLKKQGVIKNYTIDIDHGKLGLNFAAYVFVNMSLEELKREGMKAKDLISQIRKEPLVESADTITGDVDIILKMRVRDIHELNNYIINTLSDYKGVERTKTSIILSK